jgi:hypothetical protein
MMVVVVEVVGVGGRVVGVAFRSAASRALSGKVVGVVLRAERFAAGLAGLAGGGTTVVVAPATAAASGAAVVVVVTRWGTARAGTRTLVVVASGWSATRSRVAVHPVAARSAAIAAVARRGPRPARRRRCCISQA